MQIPARIPGLRAMTLLLGVLFFLWIPFEGALWRVTLMGVVATSVVVLWLARLLIAGRRLPQWLWVLTMTGGGAVLGFGTPLVILLFMALKTGLHAHGPEFTLAEIEWVRAQLPLWFTGGTLLGLGAGLVVAGMGE